MELDAGHPDVARSNAEDALAMRRELGIPHGVAHALLALAAVEYGARNFGRARDVYAEAAAVYEEAGSRGDVLGARIGLAECALLLGAIEEAEGLLREALGAVSDLADLRFEFETQGLRVAAMLAAAKGNAEASAVLLGAVDGRLRASGIGLFGKLEEELIRTYLEQARPELGETRFQAAVKRGFDKWADVGSEVRARVHRLTRAVPAAPRDLRDWIALLEREGELRRISAEVDPDLEITEITDRVVKSGGPALLFENPKGSHHPLLINQFGTERRMCLALRRRDARRCRGEAR